MGGRRKGTKCLCPNVTVRMFILVMTSIYINPDWISPPLVYIGHVMGHPSLFLHAANWAVGRLWNEGFEGG